MGIEISDIAAILKKVIHPVVHNQLRKENVLYQKVKRNVGVSVANNEIYIAARTGRHSGIYTIGEGSEPRSGKAKYQQPQASIKFAFGTVEFTDQSLEAAKGKDEKAIAGILNQEIMALKDDMKVDLNRQFHGDANGVLCLANGAGAASTTLTIDGHPAGLDANDYLAEGMYISIGGGAAVEISSVDSATQVTLSNTRTWANNDNVKKENADEMMGLAGLIDDGDNVATIQNIARASNPFANSFVDDDVEALAEGDMITLQIKTMRHGGAKLIMAGETLYKSYGLLLTADRVVNTPTKEILEGGWRGLEFSAGGGKSLGVMLDPDTWTGYLQFVDFDALTLAELSKPFQWLEADQHGGILKRSSTNRTVWEGTLKYYANLVALKFKSMGRMSGKT